MKRTPEKYKKPKIDLSTAEYVLIVYYLPAYVWVDRKTGKAVNRRTYGMDNIKDKKLAFMRLLKLIETKRHQYSLAILKKGWDGPISRVWLKGGEEIPVEEFERRRQNKGGSDVPRSLLRVWVLPHEHLLSQMKAAGIVSDENRGVTWFSTDVDVDAASGKFVKGYDVSMCSIVNMLKQIRGQFAEARIYDNCVRKGEPLAVVTWQGGLIVRDELLMQQLQNSKYYSPAQLGLINQYYE